MVRVNKSKTSQAPEIQFSVQQGRNNVLVLNISGRMDATSTALIWKPIHDEVNASGWKDLVLDLTGLHYCDVSGISLLLDLQRIIHEKGGESQLVGLKSEFQKLLDLFPVNEAGKKIEKPVKKKSGVEEIGAAVEATLRDLKGLIEFIGALAQGLFYSLRHPGTVRWKDMVYSAEKAGVNALPIVLLVSFLVGLIMAFQAAIPMKMFGAEIYVANLISISMVRELGPLMTAIVLAGRSGTAFAAELGTMKVNEEINALTTMGLDPLKFLVVPRVIAATIMTPLLTVFADLVGIIGGAVVLLSLGYPLVTYYNQVVGFISYVDLSGGLFKSFIFGIIIAGIGCMRGLETQSGPSAVGDSTTKSVVSNIILITITDGAFAVIFYYLGV